MRPSLHVCAANSVTPPPTPTWSPACKRRAIFPIFTFPHLYIAVAPHGATLLGWMAVEHRLGVERGEIVEISGLIVDASQRGAGIGRALRADAEQWGKKRGVSTVWVSSNIARTGSHPFYERAGFTRPKTRHRYCKTLEQALPRPAPPHRVASGPPRADGEAFAGPRCRKNGSSGV